MRRIAVNNFVYICIGVDICIIKYSGAHANSIHAPTNSLQPQRPFLFRHHCVRRQLIYPHAKWNMYRFRHK